MVGLFSKNKDPQKKANMEKFKEFKNLAKQKKYDQALRAGMEYIRKVPNNHDALFTIGGIYYLQHKYKTAISYCDKALEIGSYDTEVLLIKALSHQKLGEKKRAIDACNKILEVDEKNQTVKDMLIQLQD